MSGDPVGGQDSHKGKRADGDPVAPGNSAPASQGHSSGDNAETRQEQPDDSGKQPPRTAFGNFWRGLTESNLTDWLLVLLTVVIAYSTWSSDKTFEHQLAEMRASSAQTDRAIETSIQNGATVAYQAALTARALNLTEQSADAATTSANAAKKSADALSKQFAEMQIADRPVLDSAGTFPPGVRSGPSCDQQAGFFAWNYAFKNSGKTIARNVRANESAAIFPGPFKADIPREVGDMAPGGSGWSTIIYPIKDVGCDFMMKKLQQGGQIVVRSILTYEDSYGKKYDYTVCLVPNANGSVAQCIASEIAKVPVEPLPVRAR